MELTGTSRLSHSDQASFEVVAGEAILIHLRTGVYYSLNRVGTEFWNLLDSHRSIAECARTLAAQYDVPTEQVEADLIELGENLAREGLAVVM